MDEKIKFFYLTNGQIIIGEESETEILNALEMKIVKFQDPNTRKIVDAPICAPLGEPFNVNTSIIDKKLVMFEFKMEENNKKVMIQNYEQVIKDIENPKMESIKESTPKIIENTSNVIIPNIKGVK